MMALITVAPVRAVAQAEGEGARAPVEVTATDYARAVALIGWNARELVINDAVSPRWMSPALRLR